MTSFDPLEMQTKLLAKLAEWRTISNAHNFPNATFLPSVGTALASQLNVLPINDTTNHADVIVTVADDTESLESDTFQVYAEEGVFSDSSNSSHVELPYAPEVRSVLKTYALSAAEQSVNSSWVSQSLQNLGVPESKVDLLLQQAPEIKAGKTRPYLRPDEQQKRVVYGRHSRRSKVHVSVRNLINRIPGMSLSYEQIKAYAASLAMNLTTEQPQQLRVKPLCKLELRLQFSPLEVQVRPPQSVGVLLPNARAMFDSLPAMTDAWDTAINMVTQQRQDESGRAMRFNVLLSRVGVFKDIKQVVYAKGPTAAVRMNLTTTSTSSKRAMVEEEHVTESIRSNLQRHVTSSLILNMAARKSMRRFVALLASLDIDNARLAAKSPDNTSITYALANVLKHAIVKSDVLKSGDDGWGMLMRLLYGSGKAALGSHDLIDHIMAGLTSISGPIFVISTVRQSFYAVDSLKIDRAALDKMGGSLAIVGDDVGLATAAVKSSIMQAFRTRYIHRAAALSTMIKDPTFTKMAASAGQTALERAVTNAKSHLVLAQWRADLFEPSNFADHKSELSLTPRVCKVWKRRAQAFVLKRSGHGPKSAFNGGGSLAGLARVEVVETVNDEIDKATSSHKLALLVDALIGSSFARLVDDICAKHAMVCEDLLRLSQSYDKQLNMLKRVHSGADELDEYVTVLDPQDTANIGDAAGFLTHMLDFSAFTGVNVLMTNRDVLRFRASIADVPQHLLSQHPISTYEQYEKSLADDALAELMGSMQPVTMQVTLEDRQLTLAMISEETGWAITDLKDYFRRRNVTWSPNAPFSVNLPREEWEPLMLKLRSYTPAMAIGEIHSAEKSPVEKEVSLVGKATSWRK